MENLLRCQIFVVFLVLVFFILLAQISFPDGNATYWLPGSSVKLPWEIKFPSSDILAVQWSFTRSGSTQSKDLAEKGPGTSAPIIRDPTFSITDGTTLVFQNANLSHNGTYSLSVTLRRSVGGNTITSDVLVIKLGKKPVNFNGDMPGPESYRRRPKLFRPPWCEIAGDFAPLSRYTKGYQCPCSILPGKSPSH